MNSREKGKRGERAWRDELRAAGFTARRGQQFAGGVESPDVICAELDWIHFEVKCVERLNIEQAMEQARTECHLSPALSPKGGEGDGQSTKKVPVVAHKRSRRAWLVTMEAELFFQLVREFEPLVNGRNIEHSTANIEHRSGKTGGGGAEGAGEGGHGVNRPTLAINHEAWARQEPRPTTATISGGGGCRGQQQQTKTTTQTEL